MTGTRPERNNQNRGGGCGEVIDLLEEEDNGKPSSKPAYNPPPKLLKGQATMESYNESKQRRQSHVLQSNKAAYDTAIDQLIHDGYHPLNLGDCHLFKSVIYSARLTSKQY